MIDMFLYAENTITISIRIIRYFFTTNMKFIDMSGDTFCRILPNGHLNYIDMIILQDKITTINIDEIFICSINPPECSFFRL